MRPGSRPVVTSPARRKVTRGRSLTAAVVKQPFFTSAVNETALYGAEAAGSGCAEKNNKAFLMWDLEEI